MLSGKRRDKAGCFSPLMAVLLQVENTYRDSAFGIVAQWTTLTGWCGVDSKKTRVENLEGRTAYHLKQKKSHSVG